MFNTYENFPRRHFTVTPSNTVDLAQESLIYCGSAGAIAVHDDMGTAVTYTVTIGTILPVLVSRVLVTGTTVTPVVGLY